MDVIAEHRLVATFPDGELAPVVLRVGMPFAHVKGDYACRVEAEGLRLWEGPTEIFGASSFQALALGLRHLRSMLAAEVKHGAVFHMKGGDHPVSVETLFGRIE